MKRFLTMAIAAVLFVGVAPLQAASQIDFAGYYAGFYLSEGNYSRNAAHAGAGSIEGVDPITTDPFVIGGAGYLGGISVDTYGLDSIGNVTGKQTGMNNAPGALPGNVLRDFGYFGGADIFATGGTGNNYKTSNHKDSDSYF